MSDPGAHKSERPQGSTDRSDDPKWVEMGRVSGLFGVRGWIKVFSGTAPRDNILKYHSWYLRRAGEWKLFELEAGKAHGKGIVAKLSGCMDRDQAAELVGADIAIPRDQLPKAKPGEYYWIDLEGLEVRTLEGQLLGRVDHLFETGANDVMVVEGDRQRLIPYIKSTIHKVDLVAGVISVDWDPDF